MTILPTDQRGALAAHPVAEGGQQTARPDELAGGNLIAAHPASHPLSSEGPLCGMGRRAGYFPSLSGGGVRHP
jgi:hypothetical protein